MTRLNSSLEELINQDVQLGSRYQIIKTKAIEIIRWIPPSDPAIKEVPPYYSDHGVEHSERILGILNRLTKNYDLNIVEIFPLLCSVWLHDIGMFRGRAIGESYEKTRNLHHLRSVAFIKEEAEAGRLPIDQWQLVNIIDICRAHRSKVNIIEIPKSRPSEDGAGDIRVRLLASLFRLSDACDVHHSRAPETVFETHKDLIPRVSKEHWKKHFRMAHVKFNWKKSCIDIPINFPEGDFEQVEQRRLASLIKSELTAELRSVEKCFEEHNIPLFHVDIIDYAKGESVDLEHMEENSSLGWTLSPFLKKSLSSSLEKLLFQPILAKEEVDRCYVEISVVKDLIQEIDRDNFKNNYLFCSHPRTGKTSLLAYLSTKAINKKHNVLWFSRQTSVPTFNEFIHKLAMFGSTDENTIIVFDNIHEGEEILSLIGELKRQKPNLLIWCASRISEFVNIEQKWNQVKEAFIEKEIPGYLDSESIKQFLDKYREMINEDVERQILKKQHVTAYYLVDVYRRLKENRASAGLTPEEIVSQVGLDVKEDNKKSFNSLNEMERMALKIISYLQITPKILLESLLRKIDLKRSVGVIDSLLKRRIVFSSIGFLPAHKKIEVETINIFDSFREFVSEQLVEIEKKNLIPFLLITDARESREDTPHALLIIALLYKNFTREQKKEVKDIIFKLHSNRLILSVSSYLAVVDRDYLQLAKAAYDANPEIEADVIASFGDAFFKYDDNSEAIKFYLKALKAVPTNSRWHHMTAHAYEELADYNTSLIYMKKAVKLDEKYSDCLGIIYSKLKRDDDAYLCYRTALTHDPKSVMAWNNIGAIYIRKKELEKAKECFEKAVAIDPHYFWSLKGLASYWRDQRDYAKSLEYGLRALEEDDSDAETWYLLGVANYKLNNTGNARSNFEKSIELNPTNCMPYRYLQEIYGADNSVDKQIECFKKLIEIHPDEIWSYYRLGLIYKIRREYKLAKKFLLKASKLASNKKAKLNEYTEDHLKNVKLVIQFASNKYCEKDITSLNETELNEIAYELICIGCFEQADKLLSVGINKAPDFSYLYATSGFSCLKQGQLMRGQELYLKSISMSPRDLNLQQKYHYEFGKSLRIDGQFDRAAQELNMALQASSKYVDATEIEKEIQKAKKKDKEPL